MSRYTKEMFVTNELYNRNLYEWDIVASSTLFKNEFKQEEADQEIILSYANALNCIAHSLILQNHNAEAIMLFRRNSLSIPFIFLARHTVELVLKYLCKCLSIKYIPQHKLMKLWEEIMGILVKNEDGNNDDLEDITIFIGVLEELDCDGSRTRYSKSNSGELYNVKPKFINVEEINNFIQNVFVKLVNSIKIVTTNNS